MTPRELGALLAEQWVGRWYLWGGDDPSGFDCSGLAVEIGKATGVLPRGRLNDWTADGLRQLAMREGWVIHESALKPGCWVFWLDVDGNAVHVEIVSRCTAIAIGASGGGSSVRTTEDAIRANAFVKPRPWRSRSGPYAFADPYWRDELGRVEGG